MIKIILFILFSNISYVYAVDINIDEEFSDFEKQFPEEKGKSVEKDTIKNKGITEDNNTVLEDNIEKNSPMTLEAANESNITGTEASKPQEEQVDNQTQEENSETEVVEEQSGIVTEKVTNDQIEDSDQLTNTNNDTNTKNNENIQDVKEDNKEGSGGGSQRQEVSSEIEHSDQEEGKVKSEGSEEFLALIRGSSLLHTKEQLKQLEAVKEAVKTGTKINTESITNKDTKAENNVVIKPVNKGITKSSITFYLNSIMYHSKNNWVIWINGNRITKDRNNTDLVILKVSEQHIKCQWTTGYGKFVKSLIKVSNENQMPLNTKVEFNDNIATVEFLLKPNQAFKMSNYVAITEGR